MRKRTLALVVAAAGLASACAPTFEARVARFSQLPATQESFVIAPRDKENEGGLEFATYANLVRQKLVALGYREAAGPADAALTVQLDYNVGAPREKVRSRPGIGAWGPGWGGWGPGWGWNPYWGGFGGWGGFGAFGGWGGGWGNEVYSVTQYNSVLAMKIIRNADKQSVFEGRAETVGTSNNLPKIVPNLVTAIFTNFPGNSGETVRVRFDPKQPAKPPTVKALG